MSVSKDYKPRYFLKQIKLNADEKAAFEALANRLRMPFSQLVRLLLEREYQNVFSEKQDQ